MAIQTLRGLKQRVYLMLIKKPLRIEGLEQRLITNSALH